MIPLSRRAAPKKRILMLVAPKDFYEPEYFAPRKLFVDEGFDVDVVSGEGAASGVQGTQIAAGSVSDADQADYAGMFVVGGKGMIEFSDDANAQRLLRKFLRAKKPVALVCHGPLLAAKAKAAAGKDITGWPDIRKDMEKAGGKWTGMPIERDGLLFTAVGPDDAEDLAYALASAARGDKMLARSEAALLDTPGVFRKLAAIHRMAAAADEDDEEEFLRQLQRYEEEFGLEPVIGPEEWQTPQEAPEEKQEPAAPEAPVAPEAPAAPEAPVAPAVPVASEAPEAMPPKPVPPKPSPKTVIKFNPPRTDGSWAEAPAAPPAGFPFPAESLQSTESLTALFSDQAAWDTARAAAAHPLKKAAMQEYLVPIVVRLIGKTWWENNRRRDNLKGAPFGVFDKDLRKEYRGQNMNETVLGRSAIAQINMEVADLLGYAVSNLNAGYDICAYLYRALHNRMVMFAGKTQGFELYKQAACAYCRWKLNMPSRPPKLELAYVHDMRKKHLGSGLRERRIYKCPRCADMIETLQLQAQALDEDITHNEESLEFFRSKQLVNPDNKQLKDAIEGTQEQIAAKQKSLAETRKDIDARRRLSEVPYQHLVCINPDCPGVKIPLTFIDWNDEGWQSGPEGARRVKQLAEVFALHRPEESGAAEADDAPPAVSDVPDRTFGARPPPPWMRRVPFICPFDGSRFTPEEAFGRGYVSKLSGRPLGGMLVDAVRTNLWRQPAGAAGRKEMGEEEARSESDHSEIMFYRKLAPYLRMALLDEKDDKLTYIEEKGRGRVPKLRMAHTEDLYDAVVEWGLDNSEDLVGFFVGRVTSEYTRQKKDPKTGLIMKEKTMGRWHKRRTGDLMAAMWQAWLGKMLERHGSIDKLLAGAREGGGDLASWFTTMKNDGIPPRAAFIGKVEQVGAAGGSQLIIKSPLRYGEKSPLGKGRGGSYGKRPRLAWLEGVWKYPVKPSAGTMANIVHLENAAPIMSGTNMLNTVNRYDFHSVVLDASMTDLNPGDYALCAGLFMPDHRAWYPMKRIMWLRNEFMKNEKRKSFLAMLRETANESELDHEEFEKHMRIFKRRGLPDELEEFDRLVTERRKKE